MKAIHCKTKDEFKRVLEIFEEKGWKWANESKNTPLDCLNYWETYGEYTYIIYDNPIAYGAVTWEYERDIITFEEFLELEGKTKEATKSFPRVMLVSDDKNDPLSNWEKIEVLGYIEGTNYPWIVAGDMKYEFYGYKHAKEIDEEEREAIELLESKGYKVTK